MFGAIYFLILWEKKNTKVVALNAFCKLTNKQEKANYNNHLFFSQFDVISVLFVDNCQQQELFESTFVLMKRAIHTKRAPKPKYRWQFTEVRPPAIDVQNRKQKSV